jgi:nucleoside-diphosphate-sugar epimerase
VKALVTGSAGFVGRHMVAELDRRGWEVDARDIVTGRCLDNALEVFFYQNQVYDLVVHAAAQAPHRAAIDRRPATAIYNRMLDAAMFEWAVRTGQRRVLYLSSSAVYPVTRQLAPAEWGRPLAEIERADFDDGAPPDPYGETKLLGERLALAAEACGVPVHVVRPFSGYGEDQSLDFPFGAFLDRVRRREDPFPIWGDGRQVRDWIHIDDVVAGALAAVEQDVREPVNLCTGRGTPLIELAAMMHEAAGYAPDVALIPDAPGGVAYRVGDPGRLLGIYRPKVSLEEGVARALAVQAVGHGAG